MSELIPNGLQKGKDVIEEGKKIGSTFEMGISAFQRERGCSLLDWRRLETQKGNVLFVAQMGLATVQEQVEATKELYDRCKNRGVDVGVMIVTSNWVNGLPPDLRSKAPKGTSFILEGPEDFARIAQIAPIMPLFADNMCGTPNSVSNTMNALKAGAPGLGTMSQFTWNYPYWHDDVQQVVETVKAIGIIASKRKDGAGLGSYVGDGTSAGFIDHASEVGYCLLEQYVVEKLCGARYSAGLGGLISHIPSKMATWLAVNDVLKEAIQTDEIVLVHVEGNTLEVTEDAESNYGLVLADFLPYAILERKYRTGAFYSAKPVMEAIRVPTVNEIADVILACAAGLRKVPEFEEARTFDETEILKLKATLVSNGKKFFQNIMKGLPEMGVDINDPVQVLLAVRRLGGARLEQMYHPVERDQSRYRGISPLAATDLINMQQMITDFTVEAVRSEKLGDAVSGKKIVTASTDTHEFALYVLDGVLNAFKAKVVDAGVDLDAEQVLDAAFKEGTPYIAVSTHNGQCLEWGTRLTEEAKRRQQQVTVFMGGVLNTIVEEVSEPIDVTDKLTALGIKPCSDVVDLFKEIVKV
jgi:methylmalonyl-CoA mutase cobalamin-binding subunit